MKFIPESLEESLNFERGLDPKKAMRIGLYEWKNISWGDILKCKEDFILYNGDLNNIEKDRFAKKFLKGQFLDIRAIDWISPSKLRIAYWLSEDSEMIDSGVMSGTINKFMRFFDLDTDKTLDESLNFERGMDPKESMDIGLEAKLKRMISLIHMEPMLAEYEYFGSQGNGYAIYALKSVLWDILYYKKDPYIAFKKAVEDWHNTKEQEYLIKKVLKEKLGISINESLNFERGLDPKKSMGIGDEAILPNLIDSYVLEKLSIIDELDELMGNDRDEEEIRINDEEYVFLKRVESFLKDKIEFADCFDWKEEKEMMELIEKHANGRYVYNAMPSSDSYQVVFSKIYLPKAEQII